MVKNLPANAEDIRDSGSNSGFGRSLGGGCGNPPWVGKIPWRRAWQPTPVFLPEESHGQRSLVGYSLWGSTESDMTERLSINTPLSILSPSIHECRMDVFAFILIFFNFFQQSCVVSDVIYFLG